MPSKFEQELIGRKIAKETSIGEQEKPGVEHIIKAFVERRQNLVLPILKAINSMHIRREFTKIYKTAAESRAAEQKKRDDGYVPEIKFVDPDKIEKERQKIIKPFEERCKNLVLPILEAVNSVYANGEGEIKVSSMYTQFSFESLSCHISLTWDKKGHQGVKGECKRINFLITGLNTTRHTALAPMPKVAPGESPIIHLDHSKLLNPQEKFALLKSRRGRFKNITTLDTPNVKDILESAVIELIDQNLHQIVFTDYYS